MSYLHLFANCILVNGYNRSIIYDLHRRNYEYIPNELFSFLEEFDGASKESVDEYLLTLPEEDQITVQEYIDFLLVNEYVFISNLSKDFFPKISKELHSPFHVNKLVVELDSNAISHLNSIENNIKNINISSIVFRIYDRKALFEAIGLIEFSHIRNVEFYLDNSYVTDEEIEDLINESNRISIFTIYNQLESKQYYSKGHKALILKTTVPLSTKQKISLHNMAVGQNLFFESLNYNPFYNKRVHIDLNGNYIISNFPSKIFGNVRE